MTEPGASTKRNAIDRGHALVALDQPIDRDGGSGLCVHDGERCDARAAGSASPAIARHVVRTRSTLDCAHAGIRACPAPSSAATCASTRWCGCAGSPSSARSTAVLVVYYGLDFELPIYACLAAIVACGLAQRGAARCAST